MKAKLYSTLAITTLCLSSLGGAYAASSEQNDALGITDAPISLTQAVVAAEQHIGGKASKAEYEQDQGRWVFDVEVVKGDTVMDVEVDPTTGKVLSAVPDKMDQGDDEDREGGDEGEG
ncbi:PepSY domain-containing protein [Thiorhodococcus mannitoliphagus]|uniref:PepSY domain-containing protein n=1 Tax=Thiorhodococcus mannitoliphagus TaxID=329406 RepID=A0A6P1DYU3_9GAMM|nr:PepSY domain-containing protein [Thiorhodococcus mannitoliphagus]NEX22650.1 PepSY domain-containing protein [Thiorhodococcus mannitoliphagus]